MKDYFKPKTWLITILMFMVAFGLSLVMVYYEFGFKQNIKITSASASNNITGWAWNANTGWISFNCTGDSPPCANSTYGVSINSVSGNFSGYAWSSSVGWISFQENGAPNYGFNSDCPQTCNSSNNCTACSTDGKVYGWAKILSLGDNGWIKLRKSVGYEPDYGVSINLATGDFSGWAWNANTDGSGIGWISFNCADVPNSCKGGTNSGTPCPVGNECLGGGSCVNTCSQLSNYKVIGNINRPPTVTNMTAPNWNYLEASAKALHANLNLNLVDPDSGSFGSAYQIIVTKADNTPVLDTGKCTGYNTPSTNPVKCKIYNDICMKNGATGCINPDDCVCQYPLEAELNYGTGYKWSVQVWDNYDAASALTPYSTNPDTDNNDGVVSTFTTYNHKFPLVSASYFPTEPSRGEKVKFTDASQTYVSAAPTTAISCDASKCVWLWTVVPGTATIDRVDIATPTVTFNNAGSNSIKLKVTDIIDGYWTEITIPVNVNAKLPKWKEVKPE